MNYQCMRCNKSFSCDENLLFCPFCGNAYQATAVAPQVVTQRIVIGSDSERTIQEKYWKEAQTATNRILRNLKFSLPRYKEERPEDENSIIPKEYDEKELRISSFIALGHVTSAGEFKAKLNRYLKDLQKKFEIKSKIHHNLQRAIRENRALALGEKLLDRYKVADFEDQYTVRITQEEEYINNICLSLAEAMHCHASKEMIPALAYDPDNVNWAGYDEPEEDEEAGYSLPESLSEYARLLEVLMEVSASLLKIVEENSTFILSSFSDAIENLDEDEAFIPSDYIPQLNELAHEDYDPIFGKTPDEFLIVFAEAVYRLSWFIENLPSYQDWLYRCPEENTLFFNQLLDDYKIRCLRDLIDRWSSKLSQELDKTYQEQRLDMISLSQAIEQISVTED